VPALELPDGRVIAQSTAILEFLEEAHPDAPPLLPPPSDPFLRAQVRNLCGIIGSDTQPFQMSSVQAKVRAVTTQPALGRRDDSLSCASQAVEALPESERAAAKLAWVSHWIVRGLAAFEAELARCAGVYSVGDRVTLADVFLLPQVYNARLADVDLAAFPRIRSVVSSLEALPAFARAHPDAQPDAVAA